MHLASKISHIKIKLLLKQQCSLACEPVYIFELLSGFLKTGRRKKLQEKYIFHLKNIKCVFGFPVELL